MAELVGDVLLLELFQFLLQLVHFAGEAFKLELGQSLVVVKARGVEFFGCEPLLIERTWLVLHSKELLVVVIVNYLFKADLLFDNVLLKALKLSNLVCHVSSLLASRHRQRLDLALQLLS